MANLILYQFEQCPFCAKVRSVLDEKGLEYEKVDVSYDRDDSLRKKIAQKSGVGTVPVLQDGDMWIGESSDIISYLQKKY